MKIIEKIIAKRDHSTENAAPCIVFFGDSVTQGIMHLNFDLDAVYHHQVYEILKVLFPDTNIDILNAGIGGTTAEFGLTRLERDVLSKNPDLCVVAFGLNDCHEGENSLEIYLDSLKKIFTALQEKGIEVIFMTPNMMNTKITKNVPEIWEEFSHVSMKRMTSGFFDNCMEAAVALAKECNVPVCDCYSKWKLLHKNGVDTSLLLANGINHPIPEMHKLFAYSIVETMFTN